MQGTGSVNLRARSFELLLPVAHCPCLSCCAFQKGNWPTQRRSVNIRRPAVDENFSTPPHLSFQISWKLEIYQCGQLRQLSPLFTRSSRSRLSFNPQKVRRLPQLHPRHTPQHEQAHTESPYLSEAPKPQAGLVLTAITTRSRSKLNSTLEKSDGRNNSILRTPQYKQTRTGPPISPNIHSHWCDLF